MRKRAGLATLLLGISAAAAASGQDDGPTILVEFGVEDRRGAPIADLKPAEIELRQDGVAQAVLSLEPSGQPGGYVVRYVPRSAGRGPLMLRVVRPGAVARGPGGGALKIRVVEALKPLERRLVALLDAAEAPRGIEHDSFVLHFERDGDLVHHTFVVEVPLGAVELGAEGGALRGSLALMAQAGTYEMRIVVRQGTDTAQESATFEMVAAPRVGCLASAWPARPAAGGSTGRRPPRPATSSSGRGRPFRPRS